MMWNALRRSCQPHQHQLPPATTPPSPPLQTCSGPGRLQDRRTKQQIKASSSKHIAGSRRASAGGRWQGAEQCSVCVCVCVCVCFKANRGGTQLLSGGRFRCGWIHVFLVCVWGVVWPLSDSLHRESSAFHKCISVSSQRDKNTQRLKGEWEFRGVEGWLTD